MRRARRKGNTSGMAAYSDPLSASLFIGSEADYIVAGQLVFY